MRARAATLSDILAWLNAERVRVIQSPEFQKRMEEIGTEPIGNSARPMARQIKAETDKSAVLVNGKRLGTPP